MITSVVKELRQISLDFNCTIILLAQINRSGDSDPKMKDLKETGELEQSATQVLILNRYTKMNNYKYKNREGIKQNLSRANQI